MRVLYVKCPKCGCKYLVIDLVGRFYYVVHCMQCKMEFRLSIQDYHDKLVEHE